MVGTLPPSLFELRRTSRFAHPTAPSQDEGDRPESAPFALIPIPAVDTVPRDSKPPARAWS